MPRIDKSKLTFGTKERIEDHKYLDSYRHKTCMAAKPNGIDLCGNPAIPAHIRTGEDAGTGRKPGDDMTVPLCSIHHEDQERYPRSEWWMENVFKPMRRREYRKWKRGL